LIKLNIFQRAVLIICFTNLKKITWTVLTTDFDIDNLSVIHDD